MKYPSPNLRRNAGFALAELLVGAAAASIIVGGLMIGSISMQRSLLASEQLARSESDILRVADYMARDARNATSINTTATSTVLLTLTTGDYYNRNGTPSNLADDVPNTPVLGRYGATYGSNSVTIRYVRNGDRIGREVTRVDGGAANTATTWIADNVPTLTTAVDAAGKLTVSAATAMKFRSPKTAASAPSLSFVSTSVRRN